VTRLVQAIRTDVSASTEQDLSNAQRQALDTLLGKLDAMPAASARDGLSNRDHHQILDGAAA
jgi:hypothetical protein